MDREERIIENEKLFREVNERVAQIQGNYSGPDPEWVCECGDETCFEKISVSLEDYLQVRSNEAWFMIRPGHEKPDVERVVHEYNGVVVVEKFAL
jgi:23S rRNA A1618 N6-methylase RlmF